MDISCASAPGPLNRALETIKRLKAQLDMRGATRPPAVVGIGLPLEVAWEALLGHRDTTEIDETTSLFDYGLDSLMAVDLARALSATFAIELSFAQIS